MMKEIAVDLERENESAKVLFFLKRKKKYLLFVKAKIFFSQSFSKKIGDFGYLVLISKIVIKGLFGTS